LGLRFDYLCEQEVKNINKPIRAYHLTPVSGVGEHRIFKAKINLRKKWLWAISSAILIVFIIVGVLYWKYFYLPAPIEMGSGNKMSLHFPEGPSIAVLPFDNMSKDPEQQYFCDGITENIIAVLSHIPKLLVIARNSTFEYKGKSINIASIYKLKATSTIPQEGVRFRQ
jgi:adenylate cyclase